MNPITKLRFRKNPPADVPPDGFVDLVWDADTNQFVARDSDKSVRQLVDADPIVENAIIAERSAVAALVNKTLTNPTINNYIEGTVSIGSSGSSKTISLTTGTLQTTTLTANCTFTMPSATAGKSFVLKVMTGSGSFTPSFTGVKWPDGTSPTFNTTANRYYFVTFQADGIAWSGAVSGVYMP
jgi:hypothetical protein